MPRGDKSAYTEKQKQQGEHIEGVRRPDVANRQAFLAFNPAQ